jgi:acetylornithine deacetylase/succinyl-diaminopimelate desuccinylase-like protein
LIEALTTLRSPDGKVLIDSFYDDVVPPTPEDEDMLAALPFEEDQERARLGTSRFVGDATGIDLVRRYFFEPTCNIAGLDSGYTVPGGSKTVLPKQAMAKLDMRLVPNQDPEDIVAKLKKHLSERGFDDIEVTYLGGQPAVRSPADSLIGRAAVAAAKVFEAEPAVSPLMIGTGPMYPIAGHLGIPTVSPAGVCRPDSNIHAPNENVRVDDFVQIIEYTVGWVNAFATVPA